MNYTTDMVIDGMNKKTDFNHLDRGEIECLYCGMVTTKAELESEGALHWDDCPMLINDDNYDPQGDK